jgi:glycosyltransferase involved in cell wall biosynthesis
MLISIITPCLNAEVTLRAALESVDFPATGDVEHLLIDSCSSDGTLAAAARYPHLRVFSEPDSGIYDGMNKGARLARGEWLLFLQADDWLPKGTIDAYLDAAIRHHDIQMICGGADAVRWGGDGWKTVWSVAKDPSKELTVSNIALGEPMINARLIRREAFLELGGFSLDYSLASDRDFLLRAVEAGLRQIEIDAMTYRYRWHLGSSTMTEGNDLSGRLLRENMLIAKKHLGCVSSPDNRPLRRWHTGLSVQGAMNSLEDGEIAALWEQVAAGISCDPLWIMAFSGEILRSIPGFLARGGRTRSQILRSKVS